MAGNIDDRELVSLEELGVGALVIDGSQPAELRSPTDPLVSVVVAVYNHRDYIERCLRGIAMQRVDFPVEVIVGEDCSPDGTAELLRELAPSLPSCFTIILRSQNVGSRENNFDMWQLVRGKYCCFIEGDDFWTDELKLAKQAAFLEENPGYSAVYAKVNVVGRDSEPNGEQYPQCTLAEYPLSEFFYSLLPGHWSTLMVRWPEFKEAYDRYAALDTYVPYTGDRRNSFLLLSIGKIRCLDDVTGAYRHVTDGGTSFSANFAANEEYAETELTYGQSLIDYARLYGDEEMLEVAKRTYYRFLLKWSTGKVKVRSLGSSVSEIMRQPRGLSYLVAPIRWYAVLGTRALRGRPVDL